MQTVTQKNQGTKVDGEKTFASPPAKSEGEPGNAQTLSWKCTNSFLDPLRNNYVE